MTNAKRSRTRCSTPARQSSSAAPPSAISLMALLVVPIPALRSIGIAGLLIAIVSVAVAVTLLPVVLATVGPKVDWPRNQRDARPSRALVFLGKARRATSLACGRGVALGPRCARCCRVDDPVREPARRLARAEGPARIALDNLDRLWYRHRPALAVRRARARRAIPSPSPRRSRRSRASSAAVAPADWRKNGTALVTVIPTEDGNSPAGRATLDRLVPRPVDGEVSIGGEAAQGADFLERSTATSRC